MTIIIVPTLLCNFKCSGCFEPDRQRHGKDMIYDFNAMKRSFDEVWSGPYRGSGITLHGGESTLVPRQEIDKWLSIMYNATYTDNDGVQKIRGVSGIVTNGYKIDDYLISLFRKYNTYVGISCDGPPELNIFRGPDPLDSEVTMKYNLRIQQTIRTLREKEVPTSLMVILHKENASTLGKLEKLKQWLLEMKNIGIIGGRLNLMYSSDQKIELTNEEAFNAWRELYDFIKKHKLRYNPLREMQQNLLGNKVSPCVHSQCDFFSTHTLSILPDGTIGNCDRTFSEGVNPRSRYGSSSGRYKVLSQTQCARCKYWNLCNGGCPMEGTDNDWRNKTRFCEAIYNTYAYIEDDLRGILPDIKLVIDPSFTVPFSNIATNFKPRIPFSAPHGDALHGDASHGDSPHGDSTHGDDFHGDFGHGDSTHGDASHGDSGHGDAPHGDSYHGDSNHGDSSHGDMPHGDSSHGDSPDWRKQN